MNKHIGPREPTKIGAYRKTLSAWKHFENMGILVSAGLVDRGLVPTMWAPSVVVDWEPVAPATAVLQRKMGTDLWEHFEYLTVLSRAWIAAHPKRLLSNGCAPYQTNG